MTALNRLRFGTPTPSFGVTFATAFIVEIDRIGTVFRYASAGHDIGILVRGRAHRHTASTGPILGVFDNIAYAERTEAFDGDDLLILATDGFTECRSFPHGERQFGTTGIVQALTHRLAHSPSATATLIAQRADSFTGGQYRDDATLVALARRPPAAAASRNR
jgi:sigma-B regulation protein RsbU (phosphoserine phosphatase)